MRGSGVHLRVNIPSLGDEMIAAAAASGDFSDRTPPLQSGPLSPVSMSYYASRDLHAAHVASGCVEMNPMPDPSSGLVSALELEHWHPGVGVGTGVRCSSSSDDSNSDEFTSLPHSPMPLFSGPSNPAPLPAPMPLHPSLGRQSSFHRQTSFHRQNSAHKLQINTSVNQQAQQQQPQSHVPRSGGHRRAVSSGGTLPPVVGVGTGSPRSSVTHNNAIGGGGGGAVGGGPVHVGHRRTHSGGAPPPNHRRGHSGAYIIAANGTTEEVITTTTTTTHTRATSHSPSRSRSVRNTGATGHHSPSAGHLQSHITPIVLVPSNDSILTHTTVHLPNTVFVTPSHTPQKVRHHTPRTHPTPPIQHHTHDGNSTNGTKDTPTNGVISLKSAFIQSLLTSPTNNVVPTKIVGSHHHSTHSLDSNVGGGGGGGGGNSFLQSSRASSGFGGVMSQHSHAGGGGGGGGGGQQQPFGHTNGYSRGHSRQTSEHTPQQQQQPQRTFYQRKSLPTHERTQTGVSEDMDDSTYGGGDDGRYDDDDYDDTDCSTRLRRSCRILSGWSLRHQPIVYAMILILSYLLVSMLALCLSNTYQSSINTLIDIRSFGSTRWMSEYISIGGSTSTNRTLDTASWSGDGELSYLEGLSHGLSKTPMILNLFETPTSENLERVGSNLKLQASILQLDYITLLTTNLNILCSNGPSSRQGSLFTTYFLDSQWDGFGMALKEFTSQYGPQSSTSSSKGLLASYVLPWTEYVTQYPSAALDSSHSDLLAYGSLSPVFTPSGGTLQGWIFVSETIAGPKFRERMERFTSTKGASFWFQTGGRGSDAERDWLQAATMGVGPNDKELIMKHLESASMIVSTTSSIIDEPFSSSTTHLEGLDLRLTSMFVPLTAPSSTIISTPFQLRNNIYFATWTVPIVIITAVDVTQEQEQIRKHNALLIGCCMGYFGLTLLVGWSIWYIYLSHRSRLHRSTLKVSPGMTLDSSRSSVGVGGVAGVSITANGIGNTPSRTSAKVQPMQHQQQQQQHHHRATPAEVSSNTGSGVGQHPMMMMSTPNEHKINIPTLPDFSHRTLSHLHLTFRFVVSLLLLLLPFSLVLVMLLQSRESSSKLGTSSSYSGHDEVSHLNDILYNTAASQCAKMEKSLVLLSFGLEDQVFMEPASASLPNSEDKKSVTPGLLRSVLEASYTTEGINGTQRTELQTLLRTSLSDGLNVEMIHVVNNQSNIVLSMRSNTQTGEHNPSHFVSAFTLRNGAIMRFSSSVPSSFLLSSGIFQVLSDSSTRSSQPISSGEQVVNYVIVPIWSEASLKGSFGSIPNEPPLGAIIMGQLQAEKHVPLQRAIELVNQRTRTEPNELTSYAALYAKPVTSSKTVSTSSLSLVSSMTRSSSSLIEFDINLPTSLTFIIDTSFRSELTTYCENRFMNFHPSTAHSPKRRDLMGEINVRPTDQLYTTLTQGPNVATLFIIGMGLEYGHQFVKHQDHIFKIGIILYLISFIFTILFTYFSHRIVYEKFQKYLSNFSERSLETYDDEIERLEKIRRSRRMKKKKKGNNASGGGGGIGGIGCIRSNNLPLPPPQFEHPTTAATAAEDEDVEEDEEGREDGGVEEHEDDEKVIVTTTTVHTHTTRRTQLPTTTTSTNQVQGTVQQPTKVIVHHASSSDLADLDYTGIPPNESHRIWAQYSTDSPRTPPPLRLYKPPPPFPRAMTFSDLPRRGGGSGGGGGTSGTTKKDKQQRRQLRRSFSQSSMTRGMDKARMRLKGIAASASNGVAPTSPSGFGPASSSKVGGGGGGSGGGHHRRGGSFGSAIGESMLRREIQLGPLVMPADSPIASPTRTPTQLDEGRYQITNRPNSAGQTHKNSKVQYNNNTQPPPPQQHQHQQQPHAPQLQPHQQPFTPTLNFLADPLPPPHPGLKTIGRAQSYSSLAQAVAAHSGQVGGQPQPFSIGTTGNGQAAMSPTSTAQYDGSLLVSGRLLIPSNLDGDPHGVGCDSSSDTARLLKYDDGLSPCVDMTPIATSSGDGASSQQETIEGPNSGSGGSGSEVLPALHLHRSFEWSDRHSIESLSTESQVIHSNMMTNTNQQQQQQPQQQQSSIPTIGGSQPTTEQ